MPEKLAKAFISYSRLDSNIVDRLAADIEARDIAKCWVDRKAIVGGSAWLRAIEQAISDCDVFMVVCSPDSLHQSKWVPGEIIHAVNHNKRIIPLLYRPVDLPLSLNGFHGIAISDTNYEQGLVDIADILRQLPVQLDPQPIESPKPAATTLPDDPIQRASVSTQRDPQLDALYRYGVEQLSKNPEATLAAWQKVLAERPNYLDGVLSQRTADVQQTIGVGRLQKLKQQAEQAVNAREWRKATGAWTAYLATDPNNQPAREALAKTLMERANEDRRVGDWGDEVGTLDALLQRSPNDDYVRERLDAARTNLRYDNLYTENVAHFLERRDLTAARNQLTELYRVAKYFGDPQELARKSGYKGPQGDFEADYAERKRAKEQESRQTTRKLAQSAALDRRKQAQAGRRAARARFLAAFGNVVTVAITLLIIIAVLSGVGYGVYTIYQNNQTYHDIGGQHDGNVTSVVWSPDGSMIASASADKTVQVWDAKTRKKLYTYKGHHDTVNAIAWSPNSKRIVSASEDATAAYRVHVWNAIDGGNDLTYQGYGDGTTTDTNFVLAAAWSPDGSMIATGGWDNHVQVWDANTGKTIYTYKVHQDWVLAIAWSPDSTRIASVSQDLTDDSRVHVWDARTGAHDLTYHGFSDYSARGGSSIAWSPNGKYIAVGAYTQVQVFYADTGHKIYQYNGHHDWVVGLAWSPDNQRLASVSKDVTPSYAVHVWDAFTGARDVTYTGYSTSESLRVTCVSWSPDGAIIATGSTDHTVKLWSAP